MILAEHIIIILQYTKRSLIKTFFFKKKESNGNWTKFQLVKARSYAKAAGFTSTEVLR